MRFFHSNRRTRLTLAGWVFVAADGLLLLAAWNTGSNLYYLVFAGTASMLVLSWIWASRNLRALRVTRTPPEAVHRGDLFAVTVRIENTRSLWAAYAIRAESNSGAENAAAFVLAIPPSHAASLTVRHRAEKRGIHRLPPLQIISAFPFGLVECCYRFIDDAWITVYPRVRPARTALIDRSGPQSERAKLKHLAGSEFFSLRDYVAGDDLRAIAWRASARLGSLLVKEFARERAKSVLFVFDSRLHGAADFEDRFEEAIETIASLGVTLLNRQYHVSLVTSTERLREGEGRAQVLKLLDMLARVEPAPSHGGDPLQSAAELDEAHHSVQVLVSSKVEEWGTRNADGMHVLDPEEVIYV